MSAPIAATPPAPVAGITEPKERPRHRRTATGFGSREIKAVEASIPKPLREA